MRTLGPALALSLPLLISTTAEASPFAVRGGLDVSGQEPATVQQPAAQPTQPAAQPAQPAPVAQPAQPTPAAAPAAEPAPAQPEPVADPAAADDPAEGPVAEEPGAATEEGGEDPTEDPAEAAPTLEDERDGAAPGGYNAHGLGARAGLTIIPTAFLSGFLASHTNAQCRSTVGNIGLESGNLRNDGCNWFVGAEYVYRKSRNLDIVATAGYQRAKVPEGYWLDKDEWPDGCNQHDPRGVLPNNINGGRECNLGAADYTEIDMGFIFIEADFIGRGTIVRNADIEFQMGGGGGLGIGIIVGKGVYQTPIGYGPTGNLLVPSGPGPACNGLRDLADLRLCTPQYWDDPDLDQDGNGSNADPPRPPGGEPDGSQAPSFYANCSETECNQADLDAFGSRRKQEDVPPVIPVVNLLVSMRMIVKDTLGINVQLGWQAGFYAGGGLQYFFGGGGK
jgi:hypothetical protein